jgi:hypothetical protein
MGRGSRIRMRIGYGISDMEDREDKGIRIRMKIKEAAGYRLQVGPDL